MTDDIKELLVFVVVVVVMVTVVAGGILWVREKQCYAQWQDSGMACSFSILAGCKVQRADGTWVPERNYRDIQQ